MRLPVNRNLPLAALVLLAACGGGASRARDLPPPLSTGPAGDYPVVIGDPYVIGGVTFSPVDRMNYDAVGRAAPGAEAGSAISGAHHTLPLPSYVEVTALDSGRTILVRVERRGPMGSTDLIELSPGAAAQLGIAGNPRAGVRVRRVNPPELERAMLRRGEQAPARMDTPRSLLNVLHRKLDQQEGVVAPAAPPAPPPPNVVAKPESDPPVPPKRQLPVGKPQPAVAPLAKAPVTATKPAPAVRGGYLVQVGAYSTRQRAEAVAARVGGNAVQAGKVWRVRTGPHGGRAEADAALAKVRAAGYTDARIQPAN